MFKRPWPRKKKLPGFVLDPRTVRLFRNVFTQYFHHRNQPLDEEKLKELADYYFSFLNSRENILMRTENGDWVDWNGRYVNHLWNFHLHYFDYVVSAARAFVAGDRVPMRRCQSLIEWWIKQTDVGRGDGWHPYPTSLRIVNWMYAYALIAEQYDDRVFLARWLNSTYQQLDYLSRHCEYDLLANHLLKNVKALIIGYLFFGQKERLQKWETLLWEQFEEQVLKDGGHYERSMMYHAQAMADFLECYALLYAFNHFPPSGAVKRGLVSMAHFLEAMCFPDGLFALFNDSACTDETEPQYILLSAKAICEYVPGNFYGEKMGSFPETGYYVWVSPDRNEKIIIDAGPPSVEYNPGHAHCDLLSFELSLFGQMFMVDSGVHGYGGDIFREYCRSTRAHNTVMVDGIEQSRAWGAFRMARRAKLTPSKPKSEYRGGTFRFEGEYRRYNRGIFGRFDRSVDHRRFITRTSWGEWMIEDILTRGKIRKGASSFIHLHPDWRVKRQETIEFNKKRIICECGDHRVLIESFAEEVIPDIEEDVSLTILRGEDDPIQGWYFPDFGDAIPSYTIRFDYSVEAGDKFGYRIKVIS